MSVSSGHNVVRDGRRYAELEQGVSLWRASGDDTGDGTGGTIKLEFYCNPGARPGFHPYFAITRVGLYTTTAATTGGAIIRPVTADWERVEDTAFQPLMVHIPMTQTLSATEFAGSWFGFVNLGRLNSGTLGELELELPNVNLMVARCFIEGVVSQHPIAGRWWISA